MAEEDEGAPGDRDSYYAVLNIPRDASEEEVKRAYRNLAQVCHPDKASDPANREVSSANFMLIQEAYEVLSNPERRQVYDIYGKEGLESGLEVGPSLQGAEQLKREWKRFKEQQKEARREQRVSHRGMYVFKIDACELVNPYDDAVPRLPELTSVVVSNSVQLPASDNLGASVGCQVAVRRNVGGGSFVCGLKRIISPEDTLELQAAVGLKSFVSLQSTRKLGENTSASLGLSWHPKAGVGLHITSSRQLSASVDADVTWVVGPAGAEGVQFGIQRRGEKVTVVGRLEAGAVTGLSGKLLWQYSPKMALKAAAKVGTSGVELELGASQQISEFSTAGCSVIAGLQGVIIRPRFTRGGHIFDAPVLLSPDPREFHVLLGAYLLPPLLTMAVKYGVVQPLRRHMRVKKILAERMEHLREVRSALKAAAGASTVMDPVAKRKLRQEVEKGGLVVVLARYGSLEAIHQAELQDRHALMNGQRQPSPPTSGKRFKPQSQGNNEDEEEIVGAEAQLVEAAVEAALEGEDLPPAWVDVTTAVRFLVDNGALQLHKGVSKCGLMGFCDAAPGEDKVLRILYLWHERPYVATFNDKEGGMLPRDGSPAVGEEAAAVAAAARAQQLVKGDTASGSNSIE